MNDIIEQLEKQRGGRKPVKDKKTSINLYLSKKDKEKIKTQADKEQLSISTYIRQKILTLIMKL